MNLKNTIEGKLNAAGVNFRFIPLPKNLPVDIASHAAFHKIKLQNAMATILYKTEKGLVAVVKRADTQIDEKKLRQLADVETLTFASKEDLDRLGAEAGLVPYVGLDIPYFVDAKVLTVGKIYGTAGLAILGMVMEAKDLIMVNHGTEGDFTYFEKSKQMLQSGRQRILSGITPSGDGALHIGNYLGAVKQFVEFAETHEIFLMVADLHALTTIQDKKQLQKNVETLILNELALLLGNLGSLDNITFFRQSDILLHTELQSILNNVTPLGLLKRAHAYKDKLAKDVSEDEVNLGLFNYPILMAADILIYKPDLVPVGKDQKQHIEITRDIAQRFNKTFKKKVFPLPEPHIPEEIAVIMGTDGKRKMSKSLGNIISIFEDEAVIKKQVMSTYTDPTRIHATDPGHVEGNMVFHYLEFFGDKQQVISYKERYQKGQVSDVEVKEYLFETLVRTFEQARKRYQELKNNPNLVKNILQKGTEKARNVASQTMQEVREAIGLTNQYSFFRYEMLSGSDLTGVKGLTLRNTISVDEFNRMEMRVGKVIMAENKEGSEKLIRLTVSFGSDKMRTIFTGVRPYGYTPDYFSGKQFLFVVNLEPKKMMGEESQGMILAVDGLELAFGEHGEKKPLFISAENMPLGAKVR